MREEVESLKHKDGWSLVLRQDFTNGTFSKGLVLKWVFKNKTNVHGRVVRNKARLVVQWPEEDQVHSAPPPRPEAVRDLIGIACIHDIMMYQMDVRRIDQDGFLQKFAHMEQPVGFEDHDHPDHVYRLRKTFQVFKNGR